ncbi:5-oxoprolinase subunit PxpB [Halopseudomonas pelagia]|uniref:5-oxoprolinase subunit PxpB n=1 Tax=Halopseudomonas pelagia TaxID=553151 RepID=A0AA92IH28_9GAMM|nr:5-oxoprolinase subunit PxpB [Halopseudomonas pelagia]PCD00439.1 allophanate hydrolase [Halopseudomonas pelagia]QFY55142.1 5-oxoprolinase subunit PxpB [Halopseudomonas pelagia]
MKLRIETAALDVLTLRLFDDIDEANMPWLIAAGERLHEHFAGALIDLVPSYTTLMLHYNGQQLTEAEALRRVHTALDNLQPASTAAQGQLHQIGVWYDPSVGPDLPRLAQFSGLSIDGVIESHCARDYSVFALGFVPGFAYMGLVEPELAAPRLSTPRKKVPAGSVGIAERQTAVYPLVSPGGWNLLGRTASRLFDPQREGYSLLKPGDRVRFVAIDRETFIGQGGDVTPMAAEQ